MFYSCFIFVWNDWDIFHSHLIHKIIQIANKTGIKRCWVHMWPNLERAVSYEGMHYNQCDQVKWNSSKICRRLVISTKNIFAFIMPLKWAAIIGFMQSKGRTFYSNDVIWLHQMKIPLHQGKVPLFWVHQILSKIYDTKSHSIWNS